MRVVAVIPARFAAVRLPGKPLSDIHGKPMIQWVYERAKAARGLDEVIVATDDARIAQVVEGFGGKAMLTSPDCPSGTDRVAAVADKVPADIYVNIQGDEPMVHPDMMDQAIAWQQQAVAKSDQREDLAATLAYYQSTKKLAATLSTGTPAATTPAPVPQVVP